MKLPLAASAFLLLALSAKAQTGDWPRLQATKHGTMLVVETDVNTYGPANFTRCRLQRVDASELTCTDLDRKTRFTFPAGHIDAVYQVKQRVVPAVLGGIVAGCFLGGLISGNPPALAIGIIGGIIWAFVAMDEARRHAIDVWTGAPPDPLQPNEKRVLLYTR